MKDINELLINRKETITKMRLILEYQEHNKKTSAKGQTQSISMVQLLDELLCTQKLIIGQLSTRLLYTESTPHNSY